MKLFNRWQENDKDLLFLVGKLNYATPQATENSLYLNSLLCWSTGCLDVSLSEAPLNFCSKSPQLH